ncbi:unnamed protein product [Brassica oleracea]
MPNGVWVLNWKSIRNIGHRTGINSTFLEAKMIEQSKMSIIVFSENYANSTWCLEELWKIMQCRERSGHVVLPIFYKVRKSDVENQTGKNQIEVLIGQRELYRKGSRIVITTRDKKLLENNADATYVVPRLNDREAMELFCLEAFSENLHSTEEFMDLAENFLLELGGTTAIGLQSSMF